MLEDKKLAPVVERAAKRPFVEPFVSAPEDVLEGNPSASSLFAVVSSTGDAPLD